MKVHKPSRSLTEALLFPKLPTCSFLELRAVGAFFERRKTRQASTSASQQPWSSMSSSSEQLGRCRRVARVYGCRAYRVRVYRLRVSGSVC